MTFIYLQIYGFQYRCWNILWWVTSVLLSVCLHFQTFYISVYCSFQTNSTFCYKYSMDLDMNGIYKMKTGNYGHADKMLAQKIWSCLLSSHKNGTNLPHHHNISQTFESLSVWVSMLDHFSMIVCCVSFASLQRSWLLGQYPRVPREALN